jgi:hypothetical protein
VSLGLGMGGGFALLAGAAWAGLIAYAVSIPGGTGPLPLILACLAIGLAVFGLRELARLSAMPRRATFDGQVIARWVEEDNSENGTGRVPHIAVDDAQRAWTLAGGQVFTSVALGDLVQVTVNPRSGKLIDLRVTSGERPAPATAGEAEAPGDAEAPEDAVAAWTPGPAHEPLITQAEIAGLVGPPVRTTPVPGPGDFAVIVKGRDGTMSLVVVRGSFAALNTMIGRLAGTPVAGVGDRAWLLNMQRTVVARTGDRVVKLTVSRRRAAGPVPGRLVAVAAAVADRLAHGRGQPAALSAAAQCGARTRRLPSRSTAAVNPGCSGTVAPYSSITAGPASTSPAARRDRQ